MAGMPRETPQPHTASVKSYDTPSTRLLQLPRPGRVMAAALEGMCSHDTPSVWCISFAATPSRSLPWLTVDVGLATGDHDSDMPSDLRMQQSGLRATADPARCVLCTQGRLQHGQRISSRGLTRSA
jgi:hypothetical protein